MTWDAYVARGWRVAPWIALITFLACWYYAFSQYGFLLGVGLGWFPAALVAIVAGLFTVYLWGPALALAAIAFFYAIGTSRPAEKSVGFGRPPAYETSLPDQQFVQ